MKLTTRSLALTVAFGIAFSPAAVSAQSPGAMPGAHARTVHHHARRAPNEARLARPPSSQPQVQQSPPAISRDPSDCVKTTCTCLGGGGC